MCCETLCDSNGENMKLFLVCGNVGNHATCKKVLSKTHYLFPIIFIGCVLSEEEQTKLEK